MDSYTHDPDPPICRHRAGDPECMCHPEPDELSDPESDRLADVETRNKWAREAIAALPAVPRMWCDEIRQEVEETRRLVESTICGAIQPNPTCSPGRRSRWNGNVRDDFVKQQTKGN